MSDNDSNSSRSLRSGESTTNFRALCESKYNYMRMSPDLPFEVEQLIENEEVWEAYHELRSQYDADGEAVVEEDTAAYSDSDDDGERRVEEDEGVKHVRECIKNNVSSFLDIKFGRTEDEENDDDELSTSYDDEIIKALSTNFSVARVRPDFGMDSDLIDFANDEIIFDGLDVITYVWSPIGLPRGVGFRMQYKSSSRLFSFSLYYRLINGSASSSKTDLCSNRYLDMPFIEDCPIWKPVEDPNSKGITGRNMKQLRQWLFGEVPYSKRNIMGDNTLMNYFLNACGVRGFDSIHLGHRCKITRDMVEENGDEDEWDELGYGWDDTVTVDWLSYSIAVASNTLKGVHKCYDAYDQEAAKMKWSRKVLNWLDTRDEEEERDEEDEEEEAEEEEEGEQEEDDEEIRDREELEREFWGLVERGEYDFETGNRESF
eukprot:CAMPEP_0175004330 /NCGR_PEP_ID=MMETSP0005-20121125/4707_1 /TAXON_ID=420556 /ORGANISM="Ochromonas sp., Strain CCMP1393" /LENGTH=430 /DNA_ID=CAMNT_0016259471 /DNA_START=30 /DNA_END=1322 /DNA_ORIENTATION=-